jgi:hypothetical protein
MERPSKKGNYFYEVSGLIVKSDFPLPLVALLRRSVKNTAVSLQNRRLPFKAGEISWYHTFGTAKSNRIYFGRCAGGYVIRFPYNLYFWISPDGKTVLCPERSSAAKERILFHVIPLAFQLRGEMVIHASSVLGKNGAIAFLGKSGKGKSTLAHFLHQREWFFLSDDFLVVRMANGHAIVSPSLSYSRLWNRRRTHKRLVKVTPVSKRWVKLNSLFVLSRNVKPVLRPLKSARAAKALLQNLFRLETQDARLIFHEFERVCGFLEKNPIFELGYPRNFSALSRVNELLLGYAGGKT